MNQDGVVNDIGESLYNDSSNKSEHYVAIKKVKMNNVNNVRNYIKISFSYFNYYL